MFTVRQPTPADFDDIAALGRKIYPHGMPWSSDQLSSHLRVFPEGQFVAIEAATGKLVGYAATLIVFWDDYAMEANWKDFTAGGMFTNHDPERGRTLYAADIMVDPEYQGRGAGKQIYAAREDLLRRRGLLRIRAGARLQGYHRYCDAMPAEAYAREIVAGRLSDDTLSFQLKQGFKVIGVVSNYMRHDPKSLGYAAVIEYLNPEVATAEDWARQRRSPYYR